MQPKNSTKLNSTKFNCTWNKYSNNKIIIELNSTSVKYAILNPGMLLFSLSFSLFSGLAFALSAVTNKGSDSKILALYVVFCWWQFFISTEKQPFADALQNNCS